MPRTFAEETTTSPLFDDGVFRTVKVIDGRIENYDRQIERLIHDAKIFGLSLPQIPQFSFPKGIYRLKLIIKAVNNESFFDYALEPYKDSKKKYKLKIFPFQAESSFPKIKTLDKSNRSFIRDWAEKNDADDALVLSPEGYILEAAFANIFFTKNEKVFISHDSLPYMKGLTLTLYEEQLRKSQIPIEYGFFKPEDLLGSKIFICNSLIGIKPALYNHTPKEIL